MPPSYAMKITYSGSDVYFYQDEILSVIVKDSQPHQIHIRQDGAPEVVYFDQSVPSLEVTFDLAFGDTETRLNAILDAFVQTDIYYAWQYDTSLHIHAVPLVDGVETVERYGYAASVTRTVTFIQVAA